MAKIKGTIDVDVDKCKGCDLCVHACPTDVLTMSEEVNRRGYTYSIMKNPDACIGCANCAYVCPDSCITVYKIKA